MDKVCYGFEEGGGSETVSVLDTASARTERSSRRAPPAAERKALAPSRRYRLQFGYGTG